MCGIFCLITKCRDSNNSDMLTNQFKIFQDLISRRGPNSLQTEFVNLETGSILFACSVLWLQGDDITVQPIKNDKGIFVYNGDIFGGLKCLSDPKYNVSDTKIFFDVLQNSNEISSDVDYIKGPYAFIYYSIQDNKIYFCRDMFGRRSLLIGKNKEHIIITSVAKRNTGFDFIEIPCVGIFSFNLKMKNWEIFPWKKRNENFAEKINEFESFLQQIIKINQVESKEITNFVPPSDIDLTILNMGTNLPTKDILNYYLNNSVFCKNVIKLEQFLEESIKIRILSQQKFCQNCYKQNNCPHTTTGVLFSGGVDCAILAILADRFVEETRPIDLINVAFEKGGNFDTPDRVTGINTLKELQVLCPSRQWNFVPVNVSREELDVCRQNHICDLIYPLKSILDDSLGCALWFASRAVTENYTSPCRTLLVGMGADELFGGYTRHRAAFQRQGWRGLHAILEEDWQNLPHRNLARDDRVVSDHGRQLRTPYLDENIVDFVQNLNCWEKTFPSKDLPHGIGEKILLRSMAYRLGLKNAATFRKRALQFGSRIANSKEKGHEASKRL